MATVDLVVSAFKDDLGWVAPLRQSGAQVFIYDKGGRSCLLSLPNVGKCDHTYLHHIVLRYDNLADWTVFTPDGPRDHLFGASMTDALVPGEHLRVPRLWRGRDWGPDGRLNWHQWQGIPDRNGTNWADRYASGKIAKAELSFVEWARKYVGFDPDGPTWPGYQPGGILAVPRRAITYLPRAFYERLRDQLSHAVEPEEGHYMERLWVAVFSGKARCEKTEREKMADYVASLTPEQLKAVSQAPESEPTSVEEMKRQVADAMRPRERK